MTEKTDSSLARMLSVLDLFSDQRLSWSAEDIAETLGVSLPTCYRYLKTLSEAGLLQRGIDAQFTLGPRIVVLDHYIRQADPVLQCAIPFMKELVIQTGFDCVVSSLHGDQVLDTHREYSTAPAHRPFFPAWLEFPCGLEFWFCRLSSRLIRQTYELCLKFCNTRQIFT